MAETVMSTIDVLAERIRRGAMSPVTLVDAILARIRALEPLFHSYVRVLDSEAVAAAAQAEAELSSGHDRGPLHGIPVAVKDSIAVAGYPTTNGSSLMAEHITDYDATAVSRLRDAGAIIIGKSNMHEWGMGGTCTGMHFGTTRNPWDLTRVPGGSSGGSAVAVSAGLAVAAVAADGWGSVRTPASYCGVVGFKPSHGLVSRFGELPPTSSRQHQIGVITRSVPDAAIMLKAIAGYDPRDPMSLPRTPPRGLADLGEPSLEAVRIGVARSYFYDDAVPAVVAAVERAAVRFAAMGAEITEVSMPALRMLPAALAASAYESQSVLLPLALAHPDGFATPSIRFTVLAAEFVREADARRARQVRNRIRAEIQETFELVDLVLTPCNSTTAFPVDAQTVEVAAGELVDLRLPGGQSRITTRLTLPWNLAGVPAISFPSGEHDAAGLPIALHLAGRHWEDPMVLRAAYCYERSIGGFEAPPLDIVGVGVGSTW